MGMPVDFVYNPVYGVLLRCDGLLRERSPDLHNS